MCKRSRRLAQKENPVGSLVYVRTINLQNAVALMLACFIDLFLSSRRGYTKVGSSRKHSMESDHDKM